MDFVPQYLTCRKCHAKFPVDLSIDEYCAHNNNLEVVLFKLSKY